MKPTRWIVPRLFALACGLALALPAPSALAQDPGAPAGDSGDPLYGYLATAALGGAALFLVCKSARRAA